VGKVHVWQFLRHGESFLCIFTFNYAHLPSRQALLSLAIGGYLHLIEKHVRDAPPAGTPVID
jgi:hypothetical protein